MLIEAAEPAKRANQFCGQTLTAPIGLFAIAAQMVGTVDAARFDRVRVYLIACRRRCRCSLSALGPAGAGGLPHTPIRVLGSSGADSRVTLAITAFTTTASSSFVPDVLIGTILRVASWPPMVCRNPRKDRHPRSHRPRFYNFPHAWLPLPKALLLFKRRVTPPDGVNSLLSVLWSHGINQLFGSINFVLSPFIKQRKFRGHFKPLSHKGIIMRCFINLLIYASHRP